MTKTRLLLFAILALLVFLPIGVKAYIAETGNSVYIPKGQTVDTNFFTAGAIINIDGNVKGDVICAGQTININGKVDGDVICVGQTININGDVGGSVRVAGNSVNINSTVGKNVYMAGATLVLGGNAKTGWDMIFAGATADLRGKIGGDLIGAGGNVVIDGQVGKNVRLRVDSRVKQGNSGLQIQGNNSQPLTIAKDAVINGNVTYTSNVDAKVDPGATIKGKIEKKALPATANNNARRNFIGFWAIISVFGALVVGLVLVSIWKKQIKEVTDLMLVKPAVVIGWGAVILFLTPIAFVLLLITVIGIPLAFISIAVWLIAMYISKIIVAILIGQSLLEKFWQKRSGSLILAMVIGVLIVWIVSWIPILGWLVGLVAVLWGLGGIWQYLKSFHK